MRKPGRSIHLTSTREPRWRDECEMLILGASEFEVRDTLPAHASFCMAMAQRQGWSVDFKKTKVSFVPPSRMRVAAALANLHENGTADALKPRQSP